ncbi:guanine deaminase [Saccharospirillum impatiens]|uniref:guanine deaminase n=1 Tax=Saccharospirillum impatiens TaxID=169438 RepID=UPI0003FFB899|nr:guanine deaminase [Saccharospirillum impatiens]
MTRPAKKTPTVFKASTPLSQEVAARATVLFGQTIDFPEADQVRHCSKAALVLVDGRIAWHGPVAELPYARQAFARAEDYGDAWILPGLIDTHVHAAQMPVIASWGEQLLDWLNRYTFPAERRFEDPAIARQQSNVFLDALLAHGTTTAMVFGTVHEAGTDALFDAAHKRQMALIAGKVLMDRNCPDYLSDTADSGFDASARLIHRWHGTDRLHYAITPRFAPTSTEAQLERAGALHREADGLYMQTHVSENQDEVNWVQSLFPNSRDYVDVYQHYGLLHDRAVLAHGIHLTDREWSALREHQSRIAVCPTSNTFLGSGLFDFARAEREGVALGLASDVGGGTSLSQLVSAAEAYKVGQLQGYKLTANQLWHQVTSGNARALHLDSQIGTLDTGKMADLVVLDTTRNTNLSARLAQVESLDEALFATLILGDERLTRATWVAGERLYHQ